MQFQEPASAARTSLTLPPSKARYEPTAPPGVFHPPRSHTHSTCFSSGEKTTPVAPSMDVA